MGNDATKSAFDGLTRSFGKENVPEHRRRELVTALFDKIAPRYDLMNDLMSFGLHRLWKKSVTQEAARKAGNAEGAIVDLAGGTGDIALGLRKMLPGRDILIVDASSGMLEIAAKRTGNSVQLIHAPGEAIPLGTGSACVITLVFGLRNMTDPSLALRECARILKPGGSLLMLEFSKARPWFRPFYSLHSNIVIPALGALIARDKRAYSYLVESIRLFPCRHDIVRELAAAGLRVRSEQSFMFGVASLHSAEKA